MPRLIWTEKCDCGGHRAYEHDDGKVICITCRSLRNKSSKLHTSSKKVRRLKGK